MRALCLAVLLSGCVAPQPALRPVTGDDVTVFVHGYEGSQLVTETGEIAWMTPALGLSHGDRSLARPFEGQRDLPRYGPLHTTGPLTKLTVLPGLFEVDAYHSWLEWARDALPGFVTYAYDWRADVRESGAGLCAFIGSLGPGKRVRIVAHSMGGLVALHCLRSGPAEITGRVTRVVFAATPFRGSPKPWGEVFTGVVNQSNVMLMNSEALLTFDSTWQLMSPQADFFADAEGRPVPVPAFDAQAWVERKWAWFGEGVGPGYRQQLEARLAAHAASWAVLGDQDGPAPTWKVMAIVGRGGRAVSGWTVRADGSFDFSAPRTAEGDGTVLVSSARPPKPIVATIVETTSEHSALLRDSAVQAVIADFLR
ncbi:MAG: hypothetical protein U0228_16525 [Myxococcaceae bacterium]